MTEHAFGTLDASGPAVLEAPRTVAQTRERGSDMAKRTCTVDGCERGHEAHGYCRLHYRRFKKHGTPDLPARTPTMCRVEGCEGRAHCRKLCGKHWQRWRRYGDPNVTHDYGTVEERFWAKVDVGLCWEWTGARHPLGYGNFNRGYRKGYVAAHRWAWEHLVGEIPAGLTLDHLCRNTRCVNPDHLEPVPIAENIRRAFTYRRAA